MNATQFDAVSFYVAASSLVDAYEDAGMTREEGWAQVQKIASPDGKAFIREFVGNWED